MPRVPKPVTATQGGGAGQSLSRGIGPEGNIGLQALSGTIDTVKTIIAADMKRAGDLKTAQADLGFETALGQLVDEADSREDPTTTDAWYADNVQKLIAEHLEGFDGDDFLSQQKRIEYGQLGLTHGGGVSTRARNKVTKLRQATYDIQSGQFTEDYVQAADPNVRALADQRMVARAEAAQAEGLIVSAAESIGANRLAAQDSHAQDILQDPDQGPAVLTALMEQTELFNSVDVVEWEGKILAKESANARAQRSLNTEARAAVKAAEDFNGKGLAIEQAKRREDGEAPIAFDDIAKMKNGLSLTGLKAALVSATEGTDTDFAVSELARLMRDTSVLDSEVQAAADQFRADKHLTQLTHAATLGRISGREDRGPDFYEGKLEKNLDTPDALLAAFGGSKTETIARRDEMVSLYRAFVEANPDLPSKDYEAESQRLWRRGMSIELTSLSAVPPLGVPKGKTRFTPAEKQAAMHDSEDAIVDALLSGSMSQGEAAIETRMFDRFFDLVTTIEEVAE